MAESLYRKYRPSTFDDVVGQDHIITTIKNAIESNRLSHAYLFCGPRGTGKTTMARIVSKAVLCKQGKDGKSPSTSPCGICDDCHDIAKSTHPDVYELDAASRTGVENVREEIIGRASFAATRGNKKIYIIDEVHMLSIAAFNALLKTIEEPPEHVMFILCTTDPQKVPETILSRCQRFDFRSISNADIATRLKFVCESENVEYDQDALDLIASRAQGGMRNALTILEQQIAFGQNKISGDNVKQSMMTSSSYNFDDLLSYIAAEDLTSAFKWTEEQCNKGADFNNITEELIAVVRNMYMTKAGVNEGVTINVQVLDRFTLPMLHHFLVILGDLQTNLKTTNNARLAFEVAISKITYPQVELNLQSISDRISKLENQIKNVNLNGNEVLVSQTQDTDTKDTKARETEVNDTNVKDTNAMETEVNDTNVKDTNAIETEVNDTNVKNTFAIANEAKETYGKETDVRDTNIKTSEVTREPKQKDPNDLTDSSILSKTWHASFASIKQNYPAYGAILVTGNPSYDKNDKKIILQFAKASASAANAIKNDDVIKKLCKVILDTTGYSVGLDFVGSEETQEDLPQTPTFIKEKSKTETSVAEPNNTATSWSESNNTTKSIPVPSVPEPNNTETISPEPNNTETISPETNNTEPTISEDDNDLNSLLSTLGVTKVQEVEGE